MTLDAAPFALAKKIADAVLYEGYVLYPYRASSNKNQVRWQFGVLFPPKYELEGSDTSAMQTECLIEGGDDALVTARIRFLQVQRRRLEERTGDGYRPVNALEVDGRELLPWDEGVEQEVEVGTFAPGALLEREQAVPFAVAAGEGEEPVARADGTHSGRIVRTRSALDGVVRLSVEALDVRPGLSRLRVRIENLSTWDEPRGSREQALTRSLVAVHTLLGVESGAFLSLIDPPEWAAGEAAACLNQHTWPVLVGEQDTRDVMLSSPIILYDYPEVAAESAGEFFDSTEIDELLALRVMTLTEEEKREARATDDRAAAIIDRCDIMPPEVMSRLHGAVRGLKGVTGRAGTEEGAELGMGRAPGEDGFGSEFERFLNEGAVAPEDDSVVVAGVEVCKGSRVRLRPLRRADAQDIFASGRAARVQRILRDVDGETHVAVTLEDDPASDLHQWYGRFLYFSPDEIEPLEERTIDVRDTE